MKIISELISNVSIEPSPCATRPGSSERRNQVSGMGVSDTATLSDLGAIVSSLEKKLEGTAELRSEKVGALRESIVNGRYSVTSDRIADAMHREVNGA